MSSQDKLDRDVRSLQSFLRDIFDKLGHKHARTRQDGMDMLSSLFNDPDRMKVLDKTQNIPNSQENVSLYKWKHVFQEVYALYEKVFYSYSLCKLARRSISLTTHLTSRMIELQMKTTDAFEKQADSTDTKQKQVLDLLQKVISAASRNRSQPCLEVKTVFKCVLNLLRTGSMYNVYGHQIVGIVNHYLSTPAYVSCTSGDDWEAFLSHVLKLMGFELKRNNVPQESLYTIVQTSIAHGSNFSEAKSVLRNECVDYFKAALQKRNSAERILPLIESLILLYRQNATEARGIFCVLGDKSVRSILQVVTTDEQHEKVCELFLILLKLHAPCDLENKLSFYSPSIECWEEIIEQLHNYCIDSIKKVVVQRKQNKKSRNLQLSEKLLLLSRKCTKFHDTQKVRELEDDEVQEPAAKRSRSVSPFEKVIEDTVRMPEGLEQLTWLTYISAVLQRYPAMISEANLKSLLKVGKSLLTTDFIKFQEVFAILRALLHSEKHLADHGIQFQESDYWDCVWDVLTKSFTALEATPASLSLLYDILVYRPPKNLQLLLVPLSSHSLPLCSASLNLLRRYLSYCYVPPHLPSVSLLSGGLKNSVRLSILKWLLPSTKKDAKMDVEWISSRIAFGLLVKRTSQLISDECSHMDKEKQALDFDDFEIEIVQNSFAAKYMDLVGNSITPGPTRKWIHEACEFAEVSEIVRPFLDYLQDDFDHFPTLETTNSNVVRISEHLLFRVKFYLSLLDLLRKYEVQDSVQFTERMEALVEESLNKISESFKQFLQADAKLNRVYQIMCLISKALDTSQLGKVAQSLLASKLPEGLVQAFENVFKRQICQGTITDGSLDEESAYVTYGDSDSLEDGNPNGEDISKPQRLEMIALEALKCLCHVAQISERRQARISQLLGLVAESKGYSHFYFDLCFTLIHMTHTVFPLCETMVVGKALALLQILCQRFWSNVRCISSLWQILRDLVQVINLDDNENMTKFMILVINLSSVSAQQGIRCSLSYLQLVEKMAEADPDLTRTWGRNRNQDIVNPLFKVQELVTSQPACYRVRRAAIQTICTILKCIPKPLSHLLVPSDHDRGQPKNLETWFESIKASLCSVFETPENLNDQERVEEGVNCVSLVAQSAAKIAFSNAFMEQPTLYFLMEVTVDKRIKPKLCVLALEQECRFGADAMKLYISLNFHLWFASSRRLEELPYQLFSCDTRANFYNQFTKELVVSLYAINSIGNIEKIAAALKSNSQKLIENNFPEIYCRLLAQVLSNNQIENTRTASRSQTVENLMMRVGGRAAFERAVNANVVNIVLDFVSYLFVPDVCRSWCASKILIPQVLPYPLNEEKIGLGFAQFYQNMKISPDSQSSMQSRKADCALVYYLGKSKPSETYKILLNLSMRVHEAHNLPLRLWRLHHFVFFVNLLTDNAVVSFSKQYITHLVIYGYLRFINLSDLGDDECVFRRSVLFHLKYYLSRLLQSWSSYDEIHYFYRFLVQKLTALISIYPTLGKSIIEILELLIVDSQNKFDDIVPIIDPLPDGDLFKECAATVLRVKMNDTVADLRKKLQCLFDRPKYRYNDCSRESVRYVCSLLSDDKKDLALLAKELEAIQFKDNCREIAVHKLLDLLITSVNCVDDEFIARDACRCLGEIGPVDLGLQVLPHYGQSPLITDFDNAAVDLLKLVFNYLEDENIRVVATASNVLEKLLTVRACLDHVVASDSVFSRAQKPFRTSSTCNFEPGLDPAKVQTMETTLVINESWSYCDWIKSVTCALLECTSSEDNILLGLMPLCKLKAEFCEEIFSFLIHAILATAKENNEVKTVLTKYFNHFFKSFVRLTTEGAASSTNIRKDQCQYSVFTSKPVLRCLLRCVQTLREQNHPTDLGISERLTAWDSNFWLNLNYLHVAKAAQYCGAYLTSIIFSEIHAYQQHQLFTMKNRESSVSRDGNEYARYVAPISSELDQPLRSEIEKLLLKAYMSVGEFDGVYGCVTCTFEDLTSQIQFLTTKRSWGRVLSLYDNHGQGHDYGVCVSMKEQGLYNSLWTQIQGILLRDGCLNEQLSDIQYECGWRLGHWDIDKDKVIYVRNNIEFTPDATGTFQQFIYESIRSCIQRNRRKFESAINKSYDVVLKQFRYANLESSDNLYGILSDLQIIRTIETFGGEYLEDAANFEAIDSAWKIQRGMNYADFQYIEPVLAVQTVLLKEAYEKTRNESIGKSYDSLLFNFVENARSAGRLELAEKYTMDISDAVESAVQKKIEVAKNNRALGNIEYSRRIVDDLLKTTTDVDTVYRKLQLLHGEWLLHSVADKPSVVREFLRNLTDDHQQRMKTNNLPPDEKSKAHITLAEFCDMEFQKLKDYVQSDLFAEKESLMRKARDEIKALDLMTKTAAKDKDSLTVLRNLKLQYQRDKHEIDSTYRALEENRLEGFVNYLKGLKLVDSYDVFIFRVVALWFEDGPWKTNSIVFQTQGAFEKNVETTNLMSYKFVKVLHQLMGRLGTTENYTTECLECTLLRCAKDHPHHTLPIIFAQKFLHKDKDFLPASPNSVSDSQSGKARVGAATKLLNKLKSTQHRELVRKMEYMWSNLIDLANHDKAGTTRDVRPDYPIPARINVANFEGVPVPTLNVPTNPSGDYSVTTVYSFEKNYTKVGGINVPKKIACTGNDGKIYNMLLKGQDDLKQDAVMQQVFDVMNQLFKHDPRTRKKHLLIRTYKVVPFSQRSGIIEWCENTQTFGEYLVGNGSDKIGAHRWYNSQDLLPTECRQRIMRVQANQKNKEKVAVFLEILKNFQPAFHHFFFENFKDIGSLFERRLAYTRSVATSSIVGYILGLGDRHVMNILIDKTTAEVIHIDFGIAFEQGKLLPIPETIPFRLTRDIVDGMGFLGVEGIFRRSCEDTMEVLRKNADIIFTILEVLLFDPLYMWTLSQERIQKLQGQQSLTSSVFNLGVDSENQRQCQERNSSAARALRRLRCKLAGIQEGRTSGSIMTVPDLVSQLIQDASDIHALSRLFHGWQAYL